MSDYKYRKFTFKEPYLSKSSVLAYTYCPYQFYLQQVEGIRPEPNEAMKKGLRFHNWAEKLYDKIDKQALINGETTIRDEYTKTMGDDFELSDKRELELYKNFIEMEEKRWKKEENKKDFFPIKTEEFLYDDDLLFFGSYDRLDKYDENSQIVMEYKTGNFKEHRISDYRFQLFGYKHLIEKNYDKYNVTHLGLIFPKDKLIKVEKFKSITESSFYKKIQRVRSNILDRKFPKKGYCDYCLLYDKCMGDE